MSDNKGRRIHPDEEEVNKGVPDFGDFMNPEQGDSANDEGVDMNALLSEIRRVPSQPAKQGSAPVQKQTSAPAQKAATEPAPKPAAAPAQKPAAPMPAAAPSPAAAPIKTPAASPVRSDEEIEETSSEEPETPVRAQAPVRHLSPEERARRKAIIEAKRKKATIMLAVSATLILLAIGMGIFFIVKTLSSSDTKKKETTTAPSSASSSVAVSDTSESSTSEQTTTESTTAEPTPTPTPAVTPFPAGGPNLAGYCVVIDPGHQAVPNREQEEMSSSMGGSKDKSAKGFSGVVSGIDESEINLQTALLLKAYLESLGCEVYITRETNDVDISNKERAEFAVSYNPDVYIRLFCNYANDSKTSGMNVIVPSGGTYAEQAVAWGDKLGELITANCGAAYNGCWASGNYTGLNWASSVPSFMIRMGYLSNSDEETSLLSEDYQYKICEGIAEFVASMQQR